MKIIRDRETTEVVSYLHNFWYADHIGTWGFGFPCEADGTYIPSNPAANANYAACLTGAVNGHAVVDGGVERCPGQYTTPRVGLCDVCGREVELYGFTNTCECGADYNFSGQRLAPREYWGEETGESLADILRIP